MRSCEQAPGEELDIQSFREFQKSNLDILQKVDGTNSGGVFTRIKDICNILPA